jgi:predicted DNA-binding transcriptional regulator YafY
MYDPIMRVLTVLEVLQARDHVTGAELAERLEVDLRTVQRYIVRLKDLKIPVESSRGVGGAYRLRPGYRLPPLLLTNEEAFALSLGLHSLRQVGLSAFAPATEGALKKLGARVAGSAAREHPNGGGRGCHRARPVGCDDSGRTSDSRGVGHPHRKAHSL